MRKALKPTAAVFLREGQASFRAGRFFLAAKAFEKARAAEPRNAEAVFALAAAKERTGDITEAAILLTQAGRLRPSWPDPARHLSRIASLYKLDSVSELDEYGLLGAFAFDRIDKGAIASLAFDHLRATTPLGEAVKTAWSGDAASIAREMIVRRTDRALTHKLLLVALPACPVLDIALEKLLTSIRAALLIDAAPERFEDKALVSFVLALIRQCLANGYIFAMTPEERERLAEMKPDFALLAGGGSEQARRLMLNLLYMPPGSIPDLLDHAGHLNAVRPRGLGELLTDWTDEAAKLSEIAQTLSPGGQSGDGGEPFNDGPASTAHFAFAKSWPVADEGSGRQRLGAFFPPARLAFMASAFRVLVLGAGQRAIDAAISYGPDCDVMCVSDNEAELAWTGLRANEFGLQNLQLSHSGAAAFHEAVNQRFHIIEARLGFESGGDPFERWRRLLPHLLPEGIMLIGIPSAIGRRFITELQNDADYPGTDCSDDAARDFRTAIIARADANVARLSSLPEFYAANTLRKLMFSNSEAPVLLADAASFMDENKLKFRGLQVPQAVAAHFLQINPDEAWPGTSSGWSAYEKTYPRSFEAGYRIWCEPIAETGEAR